MAWIAYQFPYPGFIMNDYTHQTALTQFVEAAGVRFAYRPLWDETKRSTALLHAL
jgi:hypothetical protein